MKAIGAIATWAASIPAAVLTFTPSLIDSSLIFLTSTYIAAAAAPLEGSTPLLVPSSKLRGGARIRLSEYPVADHADVYAVSRRLQGNPNPTDCALEGEKAKDCTGSNGNFPQASYFLQPFAALLWLNLDQFP